MVVGNRITDQKEKITSISIVKKIPKKYQQHEYPNLEHTQKQNKIFLRRLPQIILLLPMHTIKMCLDEHTNIYSQMLMCYCVVNFAICNECGQCGKNQKNKYIQKYNHQSYFYI
eukprot:TRINITY_DN5465_c0_g1_i2.p6 TRINITY_DN5465_c0_g1~~TRINITY_DN5465_c0_g1_i2.p6  ORF type:complete len:114 (+),score=4.29 TRINITY_DN5465_c0_g1_i2:992-1333(+)